MPHISSSISRKQESEFRLLVEKLNEFILKIKEQEPNAEYYLDGSGYLNLMIGPHHNGPDATARQENIQCRTELLFSDAGDW